MAPEREFYVTLVDGWSSRTNNTTKTFILDIAMVLETSLGSYY